MPKEHFKRFNIVEYITIVLNLGKMSKGGRGLGRAKNFGALSWTFDHIRLFFKVLEERTVFKSLKFSETNKMKFMLFCRILQNVMIYP